MPRTSLVWFRVDLRLRDNPALHHAAAAAIAANKDAGGGGGGRTLAVFLVTPSEWRRHDVAQVRVEFMLRAASSLSRQLWQQCRVPLLVRTVNGTEGHAGRRADAAAVAATLAALCREHGVHDVYWNRQYEVNEQMRDETVQVALSAAKVQCHQFDDQCVVLPGTLRSKSANSVYTIYSPFKRAWFDTVRGDSELLAVFPAPSQKAPLSTGDDKVKPDVVPETCDAIGYGGWDTEDNNKDRLKRIGALWPADETEAHRRLSEFVKSLRLKQYKADRDFPAKRDGTSALSAYLAAGLISTKQCVAAARDANNGRLDTGSEGAVTWIQELIWRDFYRHILVEYPRVCMNKPFKLDTMTVPWRFEQSDFDAWCQGRTGYPMVDAAMRQLRETGWMHNRCRMIVASFLTKHLLHDWRHGERFFMRHLIDGDLASNNGGWQWAASTGTDAQPYFRVFNPHLQSERFDPTGEYIRRYVPELAAGNVKAPVSTEALHYPLKVLGKQRIQQLGYCVPIVEHTAGRQRAIDAFKHRPAEGASDLYGNGGAASSAVNGTAADGARKTAKVVTPPHRPSNKKQRR